MDLCRQCFFSLQVKQKCLNWQYVFIRPPSLSVLEQRLRERNTETEESLQKRLNTAKSEMAFGEQEGNFDVTITNDDLERAYQELREFILPEVMSLEQEKKP